MGTFTIGVPKETKKQEGRVGLTPENVKRLVGKGMLVYVQCKAGESAGFHDTDYLRSGARLLSETKNLYAAADMIVKVKEPTPEEYHLLPLLRGKILFTYLHLAGVDKRLTEILLSEKVTAIAYEAVESLSSGRPTYPLLKPMSEIAGRESVRLAFMNFPEKAHGHGSVSVLILGGGTVGRAAVNEALHQGSCRIMVLDVDRRCLVSLRKEYKPFLPYRVSVRPMSSLKGRAGKELLASTNIVISGVMRAGAEAPKVLGERELSCLRSGTFVADVAIDQGGSTAWSRVTAPGETFEKNGVTFSCVPNIPGSTVPREATLALTEATHPYVEFISELLQGGESHVDLLRFPDLEKGIQTMGGSLFSLPVADKHNLPILQRHPV